MAAPTPALHVDGPNLKDDAGTIVRLPGVDAFALLPRFLMHNGWDALTVPILREWRQIAHEGGWDGATILRAFRCAAPPNPFAIDPWSYDFHQVTELTQRCAAEGFYIDWTGGDYQVCFPSSDARRGETNGPKGINQHNNLFCAAIVGLPNCIWNTCNEPGKNGIDTGVTKPPPWAPAVQYSGNYDDNRNLADDLACINLHTDRSEEGGAQKWVGKAHESAPYLWLRGKPIFYDEGMGADEVVKDGSRSNVPRYFGILGSVISMVSVVYLHCTDGQFGNSLRPQTRACGVQFFEGFVGGLRVSPS